MDLIFVGTSSGKTAKNRFHSSLLFRTNSKNILIDTGDSISRALLAQDISINSITDIIFSHYHSDHLAGLPSLLTQMIIGGRKKDLNIFTHDDLVKPLKDFLSISFLFPQTFKFKLSIFPFSYEEEFVIDEHFRFSAKQNSHIKNKHNINRNEIKFVSSSFLFKMENQKIVYTSDIGSSEDLYLFQDQNEEIFITETTHVPLQKIEDAITILNPDKTYLTHIDDEIELQEWHDQLSANKKNKILIAEDGMTLKI